MVLFGVPLALIAVLSAVLYFYVKNKQNYWAKLGVKHPKPNLLGGNLSEVLAGKQSIYDLVGELYKKYPEERVVGFYGFTKPMLIIRDLDLIKDVLVKNFSSFVNRSFHCDEVGDPLGSEMIFGVRDDYWRGLRQKTSFAFTSGRMKKMYPVFGKVSGDLNQVCQHMVAKDGKEMNVRNVSNRYTVDVITSCAFGAEGGAVKTPETSVMYKILNDIFMFDFKTGVASNLMFFQRKLYCILSRTGLGFKIFRQETENEIYKVVDLAVTQRLKTGQKRGDIFDEFVFSNAPEFQGLKKIAGSAFQVLFAGTETSSTTIVFTLYLLAKYPDIQKKLQKEIRETFEKHGGEIPYERIQSMEYLDQVVLESLRLYPVLPFLDRIASKDYHIPGTDIIIEKGTQIFIPMWSLQKDPNYFPEPESFKPERFSKEHGHNIPEMTYMPFGVGPRYCIGKRFGILTVKSFLTHFLKDFDVELGDFAKKPLQWNRKNFTLSLMKGMQLLVKPTKH